MRRVSPQRVIGISATLAAVAWLAACDSPQPPGLCGSIPQQTIIVGETVTVNVCFDDPNGDLLDYLVVSSDPAVATATASGSTVTVTAVAPGNALVTMIATDATGLKAQQSFRVLVPNRVPVAVGEIPDREVMVGDSATVDVSGSFSDPDGQALSYAATVSDSAVADVSVADALVTVVAVAKGTVVVTVTATDPGGLSATQSFRVTVPNRPPVVADTIAALTIEAETSALLDLLPYFDDPDGDSLEYVATVSDSAVAAVSVSGGELTVAALAKGEAVVTVTATDNEGLYATQGFQVTVPNRTPVPVDTIPARMLHRGDSVTVEPAGYFADPDGDTLAYAAETSDSGVVTASVAGAAVTVTAVAQGEATVTITAVDPEGLAARQTFQVTVTNRAPVVADTIPAQTVFRGEALTLDLTAYFSDPDGDALAYVAETSDSSVVTAAVSGGDLTVTGTGKGEAVVTVTATDPGGLSARQSFAVSVPNRAPVVTDTIPAQAVPLGDSRTIDASAHFSDPDGDSLVYTTEISPRTLARIRVSGSNINIRPRERGEATVTVTATDPEGLTATQTFTLTVPNQRPVLVGTFPSLKIGKDARTTLRVSGYFRDPDGDRLTYDAETADSRIARATTSGAALTLTGVAEGQTELTITATDPDGLTATHTARITVQGGGRGPVTVGSIPPQTVGQGLSRTITVSGHFQDPDGDPLTYRAATSHASVATASATGGGVTLTGVATGQTTLSVTASDPDGQQATLTTQVTVVVRNQGPVTVGTIPEQTIEEGKTVTLSMSDYFQDPDGGTLNYQAESSDPTVGTATVAGSSVTLTGVKEGQATLTVTATDPDDLTATQTAAITVAARGRGPETVGSIPPLSLDAGNIQSLDGDDYFRHPDGRGLRYAAATFDATVVTASATGASITVRGVAPGKTTLTVTATDPSGLSATQSTAVEVNAPPRGLETVGTIPDEEIDAGEELTIEMASYFHDPNGNALDYTAGTSNTGVASVSTSGSTLYVKGEGSGTATITVVASDPAGRSAVHTFDVTVKRDDTGFHIALGFDSNVNAALESAVRGAASSWASILSATEFTDLDLNDSYSCPIGGVRFNVDVGQVDDLAIAVAAAGIDGPRGTLALARICVSRSADHRPVLGVMIFDAADLDRLQQSGALGQIALHEMAHILHVGLGSYWYSYLQNPSGSDPAADTHFDGSRAVAAFNAAGGTSYTGAKVSVENRGDDGHWRKSVLGRELMTPTVTVGATNPLSAITIQALADMGYQVNVGLAQSYSLPSPDRAADVAEDARTIDLRGDTERGPVVVVDRNGNVVEVIGEEAETRLRPGGPTVRVIIK